MTGLDKLRLWFSEFIIRMAIVLMPLRQGIIWERHYHQASKMAWGRYWLNTNGE